MNKNIKNAIQAVQSINSSLDTKSRDMIIEAVTNSNIIKDNTIGDFLVPLMVMFIRYIECDKNKLKQIISSFDKILSRVIILAKTQPKDFIEPFKSLSYDEFIDESQEVIDGLKSKMEKPLTEAMRNMVQIEKDEKTKEIKGKLDNEDNYLVFTALDDNGKEKKYYYAKKITRINPKAFTSAGNMRFGNVIEITIPKSVDFIGGSAFRNCHKLKKVVINANITQFDTQDRTFMGCENLETVILPPTLEKIFFSAFNGCEKLQHIGVTESDDNVFPATFHHIGQEAFSQCTSLKRLTFTINKDIVITKPDSNRINENVFLIVKKAFHKCNIEKLQFPNLAISQSNIDAFDHAHMDKISFSNKDGMNQILNHLTQDYVDVDCSGIKQTDSIKNDIVINKFKRPDEIKDLDDVIISRGRDENGQDITKVFSSNSNYRENIKEIDIPMGVKTIRSGVFAGLENLETVIIANSVSIIENEVFSNCHNLKTVKFDKFNGSSGMLSIGSKAFEYCNKLTDINLPSNLNKISSYTFAGCQSLKSITIPSSVKSIDETAFEGCDALKTIKLDNKLSQEVKDQLKAKYKNTKVRIVVLKKSLNESENIDDELAGLTVVKDVQHYLSSGVDKETDIETVKIPDTVKKIDDYAFEGCTALKSVTFANSVKEIGNGAFQYCFSLPTVTLPESLNIIGVMSFRGCGALKSIVIPKNVFQINDDAFDECKNLLSVTLPASLKKLGKNVFYKCSALKLFIVPKDFATTNKDVYKQLKKDYPDVLFATK